MSISYFKQCGAFPTAKVKFKILNKILHDLALT